MSQLVSFTIQDLFDNNLQLLTLNLQQFLARLFLCVNYDENPCQRNADE